MGGAKTWQNTSRSNERPVMISQRPKPNQWVETVYKSSLNSHKLLHVLLDMALKKIALLLFVMFTLFLLKVSNAAVYKVGDSGGWTTLGNIDYNKWASSKTFQIGDTIRKFLPLFVLLYLVVSRNWFVFWDIKSLFWCKLGGFWDPNFFLF